MSDVMFLINAIYFNGNWTYRFEEEDTEDEPFYLPGGGAKECRMMKIESVFKYFEDSNLQAIDIPYGVGNYSMTVILPREGEDIDSVVAGLTQEKWSEWMDSFSPDTVILYFPKLKLKYEIKDKLEEALTSLGMGVAFDGREADFTGMYEPGGIFIDRIIHKTFLEIDEEGTEAAAATVVAMQLTSIGGGLTVRLDRPFIFVIRENHSGAILFMGKIVEPVWE
jgi:serpin B